MKDQQIDGLVEQFRRMFRQGGSTRWFAIVLAIGIIAVTLLKPDVSPGPKQVTTGDSAQQTVTDTAVAPSATPSTSNASRSNASETGAKARDATRSVDSRAAQSKLTKLSRGALQSPAGLVYTRGSQQGHRLQHVLAHAQDSPNRPGQHGVFSDGRQDAVVALLDEAYQKYQANEPAVRAKQDRDRTVLTVDMGRKIGYVGGQSGNRRGRPEARHLRMVLEDERVITAYPVVP